MLTPRGPCLNGESAEDRRFFKICKFGTTHSAGNGLVKHFLKEWVYTQEGDTSRQRQSDDAGNAKILQKSIRFAFYDGVALAATTFQFWAVEYDNAAALVSDD